MDVGFINMSFEKNESQVKNIKEKMKQFFTKLKEKLIYFLREDECTLRRDAIIALVMFSLILPWMLFLKFNKVYLLRRGYFGFVVLSLKERFMLDLIPFRFTHDYVNQIITIVLNCFIFAPFGVVFNTLFKKKSISRDMLICFLISLFVEVTQLFTMLGGFATIDLITNTISYLFGLLAYNLVLAKVSVKWNVRIYRIVNLILVPFVVIATVTTIGNLDVIWGILTRTLT